MSQLQLIPSREVAASNYTDILCEYAKIIILGDALQFGKVCLTLLFL